MVPRCHSPDPCLALQETRFRELWVRRARTAAITMGVLSARGCAPDFLGTPGNALALSAQDWLPEWNLQYRIARDNSAYNREEFKIHYGCEFFRAYWDHAFEATDAQKHVALLSILRSRCDQIRMRRAATACRRHAGFDEAVIEHIAGFVGHIHGWQMPRIVAC